MPTSTPPHECNTEHEVLIYVHTQQHIDKLTTRANSAMPMKLSTPLTKAIDALSCIPFVQTSVHIPVDQKAGFTIANIEAGTFYKPKVDVILEKSTPSSFGKGSETVLDPSYRSGREIYAKDIGMKGHGIEREALNRIRDFMFPGRKLDLKLYKLAVYETGGHFDWHMDSTHSDKHHGTLLLALNTSWEGGDLVLRRNGIETPMDLRPQEPGYFSGWTSLQAAAFFTDTEHRVEPVKSGIRIVLQYDIELEEEEEEDDSGKEEDNELEEWMSSVRATSPEHCVEAAADKAALDKVLTIIKELHSNGAREVAFALHHLYRKASISANYLKGTDAILHDALIASGEFDVSLHPVIFYESFEYVSGENEHYVYRYDAVDHDAVDLDDPDDELDEELDDEPDDEPDDEADDNASPPPSKKRKLDKILFHIPEFSAAQKISRQEYIEYTGNDAMPAEHRYFGGGIFVRPKAK